MKQRLDFDRDYDWAFEQYMKSQAPLQNAIREMERQMRKVAKSLTMTDPHYRAYMEISTAVLHDHTRLTHAEFLTCQARWRFLHNAITQ